MRNQCLSNYSHSEYPTNRRFLVSRNYFKRVNARIHSHLMRFNSNHDVNRLKARILSSRKNSSFNPRDCAGVYLLINSVHSSDSFMAVHYTASENYLNCELAQRRLSSDLRHNWPTRRDLISDPLG